MDGGGLMPLPIPTRRYCDLASLDNSLRSSYCYMLYILNLLTGSIDVIDRAKNAVDSLFGVGILCQVLVEASQQQ